ncbi:antibiotic biosynthesis monooxygenase [Streptomyces roseoverticillatus]|uniref:putative quinol monooxygenase n=1 Tax=Streptomyces roseoverticillatus TaxID=66429 RepID=UPI0033DFF195
MTGGFGLVVRFTLRDDPEAAEAFDALVSRTLEGIRQHEQGTVVYVNHRVPNEPNVRLFYELYADRAAFEAHEQESHVRHFLEAREKLIVRTEVTFLERLDGKV